MQSKEALGFDYSNVIERIKEDIQVNKQIEKGIKYKKCAALK